jgi:ATP-dependent phosphofructokinase / diphosphate-dependent phosphofructokinase
MGYYIKGDYGKMASLIGTDIVPVEIVEGSKKRLIDLNSDLIQIRNAMTSVKQKSKEKLFK